MGKKIDAYQADDGKIFLGDEAKEKMEQHEKVQEKKRRIKNVIEYARKIYNVPRLDETNTDKEGNRIDGEGVGWEALTNREAKFLADVCEDVESDTLDEFISSIARLKLYNASTFANLCCFMEREFTK